MWEAIVKILQKKACHHDWEIILQKDYEDKPSENKWRESRNAHTRIVLMCKKCGKLKTLYV